MASNRNFDGLRFLVGSSLVGAKGFLKSQGPYLGSAFGTSTPSYNLYVDSRSFFIVEVKDKEDIDGLLVFFTWRLSYISTDCRYVWSFSAVPRCHF